MKVGIVGKGGTGKTTVSSLLAEEFAARGQRVLAIDTDSNPNLALSLGLDQAAAESVPVLPRETLAGMDGDGDPADLVGEYGVSTPAGVTLLNAMSVTEAGGG